MIWTPKSLLDWSESYFAEKNLPTPRLDAELLLAHILGCRRLDLYLQFDRPLTDDELARYKALVRQRAERVPVAYLTGEVGFWNLTLKVAPGCLVPRPDTETLVEATLAAIAETRAARGDEAAPLTVVELGTGSGAIPLALCSEAQRLTWLACERSAPALVLARENRALHEDLLQPRANRLVLLQADGLECFRAGFLPDLVVSNPPYVPRAAIDALEPEVSRHEPRPALDGGPEGTDVHRYLIGFAARTLAPGGRLLLEIGADQSEAVSGLIAAQSGLMLVGIRDDLAGRPRVADARRVATGD